MQKEGLFFIFQTKINDAILFSLSINENFIFSINKNLYFYYNFCLKFLSTPIVSQSFFDMIYIAVIKGPFGNIILVTLFIFFGNTCE